MPSTPPPMQAARVPVAFALVAAAVVVAAAWSGCLGIERTEWAFRLTQLDDLGDRGLTGKGVLVGIVDSGIDPDHPSLDHIKIVGWRDYVDGRAKPYDDFGHGTHVAGIIAAKGGVKEFFSGADLVGVAPAVSLVVVKACGSETCDSAAVQNGIDWAVDQGVDILVLSLGGRQVALNLGDGPLASVNRATGRGVYVVAAAGNSGTEHGDVESPSSGRLAIAVGAVDRQGRVADFSSRGSQAANNGAGIPGAPSLGGRDEPNKKPELVAPGVDILSAWDDGTYASASGTSQAAPFVAGAIALFLEERPEWKRAGSRGGDGDAVERMKQVLVDSAKPVDGQRQPHDNAAGYGILQAAAAMKRLAAA